MGQSFYFDTVAQYNDFNNHETLHPLVSVIDFSKAAMRTGSRMTFSLYCIFLKEVHCGDLKYGCNYYDYDKGTLVFISPGQVIDVQNKDLYQPMGHGLVFHPDLLIGTPLAKTFKDYNFFHYHTNEALHLSVKERKLILDGFSKIEYELTQSIDKYSRKLIASNIELFLNYCERFYDRQFLTRATVNVGILARFEELLHAYFSSDHNLSHKGLPMVSDFANELSLSANYFGDLIKKETGKSPQELILNKVIEVAKIQISDVDKSINDIAYDLGFKYSQHFSRFFKNRVGCTPTEFRRQVRQSDIEG